MVYNLPALTVVSNLRQSIHMSVRIHHPTAHTILKLAAFVAQQGILQVQAPGKQIAKYFTTDGRTDLAQQVACQDPVLHVSATEFWFSAKVKDTDLELIGQRCSLQELLEFFKAEMAPVSMYKAVVAMESNELIMWRGEAYNTYDATSKAIAHALEKHPGQQVALVTEPDLVTEPEANS